MFDETSFGQNGSRPNGFLVRPSFANPSWGFAYKAANPLVRPTNFKGPVIKEALIVFRGIEKQGRAQGLPIRTPSPALAQLPVRSLANGSDGIPRALIEPVKAKAGFVHK